MSSPGKAPIPQARGRARIRRGSGSAHSVPQFGRREALLALLSLFSSCSSRPSDRRSRRIRRRSSWASLMASPTARRCLARIHSGVTFSPACSMAAGCCL